jgi:hypothetical protein
MYCCVVPEEAPRNSQEIGAPGVDALAEKLSGDPSVLFTEILLDIEVPAPDVALNTPNPKSGVTVNKGVAPTSTVTGMVSVELLLPPPPL